MLTEIDTSCPHVRCPTSHLIRAVMNPLTNSMKYTREGHVKLSLAWYPEPEGRVQCHIAISDTGVGVFRVSPAPGCF